MSVRARRLLAPILLALLSGLALPACEERPPHSRFELGATRAELRERFGEPAQIREIWKTGGAVSGPIESFWSRVPDGGRVEIWSYPSRHAWTRESGEERAGRTELYFLDDADAVAGIAFAPAGVVYEPSGDAP